MRRLGERSVHTLIVVEGIYSMLGDRAPLAEIAAVKRAYGGYLLVDVPSLTRPCTFRSRGFGCWGKVAPIH